MACAAALRHEPVRVTLIDRENYHLFQPADNHHPIAPRPAADRD
jgi:NADH dehydrogenase FAD-containing subunit